MPTRTPTESRTAFVAALLILLTMIGGGVGLAASVFGGFALESHVESTRPDGPTLSYGQQFGLTIVPLCVLIGSAIGFSIAVAFLRYPIVAIVLQLVISMLGWMATSSMWNSQIADYGSDPSEIVLYYPPTGMCILALCVAGGTLFTLIVRASIRRARPVAT
ncbi:MAG: hypothetical protein Aurels2KO_53190 [Aureliella sp.]